MRSLTMDTPRKQIRTPLLGMPYGRRFRNSLIPGFPLILNIWKPLLSSPTGLGRIMGTVLVQGLQQK